MSQAFEESKSLPARPDKTLDWLNKSRDDWKSKTQATKGELKIDRAPTAETLIQTLINFKFYTISCHSKAEEQIQPVSFGKKKS